MPISIDNKFMMQKILCNPFFVLEMDYFLQSASGYPVLTHPVDLVRVCPDRLKAIVYLVGLGNIKLLLGDPIIY